MPLTQKTIDELKEIYKKEYGRELSEQEAWDMGYRLLSLFEVLTKPVITNEAKHKPKIDLLDLKRKEAKDEVRRILDRYSAEGIDLTAEDFLPKKT